MPVSRNAHQAQLPATPLSRTRLVTRFGVSVLKVVATIDTPISHQGAACPEVKNSAVLDPALRASRIAGTNEMAIDRMMIAQSMGARCIRAAGRRRRSEWTNQEQRTAPASRCGSVEHS